ncbi:MAG: RNA polymerase sigma factor [Prevotella sp.]|nr:RNA polymerase sigma factor [Prevotella sp.]
MINDLLALKNPMYRLALRITLNSQEAEDIVQDVIIKIWKSPPQSPPQGEDGGVTNLKAYALKAVRNLALDRQRLKVNQTENIDGMDFSSGSSIEHTLEQQERIDLIRKAMDQLPEKQRSVMQLRDFEGYSYKEIADIMEISEEQVKVNLFRARQSIRQCIIHNA